MNNASSILGVGNTPWVGLATLKNPSSLELEREGNKCNSSMKLNEITQNKSQIQPYHSTSYLKRRGEGQIVKVFRTGTSRTRIFIAGPE